MRTGVLLANSSLCNGISGLAQPDNPTWTKSTYQLHCPSYVWTEGKSPLNEGTLLLMNWNWRCGHSRTEQSLKPQVRLLGTYYYSSLECPTYNPETVSESVDRGGRLFPMNMGLFANQSSVVKAHSGWQFARTDCVWVYPLHSNAFLVWNSIYIVCFLTCSNHFRVNRTAFHNPIFNWQLTWRMSLSASLLPYRIIEVPEPKSIWQLYLYLCLLSDVKRFARSYNLITLVVPILSTEVWRPQIRLKLVQWSR